MNPSDIFPAGQAPAKPKSYVDVTEATFQAEVVDRSFQAPVVVDLWADWCGPCKQLGPVLERLAEEAAGAWTLVKIDVEANPRLAQAFRVQGIPAVKAIVSGKLASEFTGAMPEREVRAWLASLPAATPPSRADEFALEAARAAQLGDFDTAEAAYRAALAEDPSHAQSAAGLARVGLGRRVAAIDQAAIAKAIPSDVGTVTALADLDAARGELDRAFDRLVGGIRAAEGADRDRLREHLLALLALVPAEDPRAVNARKALATALF